MADLPIYSPLPGGNRAHGPLTSPDIQGMHPESALGFTVPQAAPESFGFWDHAGDIAAAVPRGLAGGLEGLLEIPSDLGGVFTDSGQLYDVPDNFGLGRSKTLVGGLTEGVSQFLIPSKLANMAAKGVKVGAKGIEGLKNIKYLGRYKKSSKLIKTDKKLIKQYGRGKSREVRRALQSKEELEFYRDAAKTAGWGNDQIKAMEWFDKIKPWALGAGVDLMVFDADEQRLSNLIQEYPTLKNPITEWLATKEDDNRIASRVKNALEGAGIGALVGVVFKGIGWAVKRTRALNDPNVTAAKLADEIDEAEGKWAEDIDNAKEIIEGKSGGDEIDKIFDVDRDIPGREEPEVRSEVDPAVEKVEKNLEKKQTRYNKAKEAVEKYEQTLRRESPTGKVGDHPNKKKQERLAKLKGTLLDRERALKKAEEGVGVVPEGERVVSEEVPEPTKAPETKAPEVDLEAKRAGVAATKSKDIAATDLDKSLREAVDVVDEGGIIRAVHDALPEGKTPITDPEIRSLMEDEVLRLLQDSEKRELYDIARDISIAKTMDEDTAELVAKLEQRTRELVAPHIEGSRELLERQARLHQDMTAEQARVEARETKLNIFPGMDPAQARFREIGIHAHTEGTLSLDDAERLVDLLDEAHAGHEDFMGKIDGVINVATLGTRANHQLLQLYMTTKQIDNKVDHRGRPITDDMDFDERTAVEAVSRLTNSKLSPQNITQNLNAIAQQMGEGSLQAQAYLVYIDRYLDDLHQFYLAAKVDNAHVLNIPQPKGYAAVILKNPHITAFNGEGLRKHLGVTRDQALHELGIRYEEAWSMLTAFGNVRRETGRALRRYHTRSSRLVSEAAQREAVEGMGGADDILKRGDKLFALRDTGTGKNNAAAMAGLESFDRGRRVAYFVNEWFVNFILSGIPTFTTNVLGNFGTALWGPLELMLGGAAVKGARAIRGKSTEEVNEVIAQGFAEFTQLYHQFGEAVKYFGRSWVKGDYILDARHGTLDVPDQMRNAMGADNARDALSGIPGIQAHLLTPEKGVGAAIEFLGKGLRLPSKVLMSTDEFFKQWTYRSVIAADLLRQLKAQQGTFGPKPAFLFDEFKNADGGVEYREITTDTFVSRELARMTRQGNAFVLKNIEEEARRLFPDHAEKYRGPFGQVKMEDDRKAWVNETMNRPGVEGNYEDLTGRGALGQRALDIARERTFTNDLDPENGIMSGMGKAITKLSSKHPMLRLFFPFIRTPLNIFIYAGRRTAIPILNKDLAGAAEYLYKANLGGMDGVNKLKNDFARQISGELGVHAQAEAAGRITAAMGFTTLFYTAAMNEIITGAGPKDKDFRRVLQQDGWQPYSIKMGDTYVSYQRLDPFATVVGLFADMVDVSRYSHADEDESIWTSVLAMSMAIGHNMQSKSYLQGLVQVAGLIEQDEHTLVSVGGRLTAAMTVPGIFASFRSITDPHTTEVRDFFDHTINRVPFLSNALLEPQRNVGGEAVTKRTMTGWADRTAGVGRAFLPILVNASSNDVIAAELASLGYPFANPTRYKFGTDLTNHLNAKKQSAYDRFLELTGQVKFGGRTLRKAMVRLINSRRYQKMPLEGVSALDEESPRIAELHRLIRRYRTKAMKEMLGEFDELREMGRNQIIANRAMRRGQDPEMLKNQMFPVE